MNDETTSHVFTPPYWLFFLTRLREIRSIIAFLLYSSFSSWVNLLLHLILEYSFLLVLCISTSPWEIKPNCNSPKSTCFNSWPTFCWQAEEMRCREDCPPLWETCWRTQAEFALEPTFTDQKCILVDLAALQLMTSKSSWITKIPKRRVNWLSEMFTPAHGEWRGKWSNCKKFGTEHWSS